MKAKKATNDDKAGSSNASIVRASDGDIEVLF
jgi:hypothetical protein